MATATTPNCRRFGYESARSRALAQVAATGDAFELLLAGDGPERPTLEKLAEALGLRARVQFLGSIEDVPALCAQGHLLVHPSLSEGLSGTVLEGMAEGGDDPYGHTDDHRAVERTGDALQPADQGGDERR